MRLKALTLQGFKTFVRRTQLDFEPGLTAIVGPNGSGKSNLADALRWVLGEQSLRNLRSRRVEDVIFTGGPGRPPAGMAEVGLTFDNSRRWLDLPYNEVAIARRAYRSGENEYYLNRERSRLRNITDLLGQIGLSTDSFAIVGQGAIDAALSLRTEDRRGLIEQAALISHLDARLEDAQRRLQDTQQNINRLNDLISELTPHLRTLERQARQAREFTSMRDEFRQGLISWYAHRWSIPDQQRCQADSDRRSADASARIAAEEAARLGPLLQDIHERLSVCQNDVQITTERVKALANERVNLCQARDLLVERRQSTNQRLSDFRQAIDGNQRDLERERAELASLAGEQSTLSNQLTEIEADIKQKEAEAASWVQQHHTLTESIADTQEAINRARGEHVSALAQQRITVERVEQLSRAIAEQTEREAKLHEELAVIKARAEAAQQELSSARAQLDQFRTEHSQLVDQRDQIQRRLSQLATELAAGDREYQALQARHDALESADEAGVGFYSGVRAVLRAANGHGQVHLDGIFGVVAKLIEAPTEAELAIETALGGHLQDIVVARWEDAEAAIAHLKSSGAGRATFLPLNTIRPNRRPPPPSRPGVLGVASELVTIAPRFRTIGDYLLGQTLVVESLSVARQLLHECPASWQIVTLDGDVARPTGVVTGGSPGANRGTLARYRELRQIRGQLAERAREREKQAASLAEVQTTATRIEGQLADLGRAMRGAEERLRRASTMVSETRRQENQCARDLAWQREELKRLEGQLETAERERSTAAMTAAVAAERVVQTSQAYENTRALLQALERETSVSTNTLGALRNQADRLRDRIAALIGEQKNVTKRIQNLELSLAERQDRLTELQQQATDLETEFTGIQNRLLALDVEAAQTAARLEALKNMERQYEIEEAKLTQQNRRWEAVYQTAIAEKQDAERRWERATAELDSLSQQIRLELGSLADAPLANHRLQVVLDDGRILEAPISALPDPERLRARLDSLRSRLRTSAANLDAIREYESACARLNFLTDQVGDLEQTAATLRQTIDETRTTMQEKFTLTYARVSEAFARHFVNLFGGGTARLVLASDDDSSGVDIVAQPPGKRSQNLAQLSGGERALTAAALLFALIETRPPPFCLLDEVDAALDESNVGRFAGLLRDLSAQSQFIVITHNRRTMEAASTIWGFTLEQHCESRVFSMRLASSA